MTKHTPATPLPWTVNHDSVNKTERLICDVDGYGAIAQIFRSVNAAYIAHAANAYPKLVEALRMVVPIIERFSGEAEPQNSVLDQRRDQLRALLRELGENA